MNLGGQYEFSKLTKLPVISTGDTFQNRMTKTKIKFNKGESVIWWIFKGCIRSNVKAAHERKQARKMYKSRKKISRCSCSETL